MSVPLRDALAALYSDFDANQLAERHVAAAKLVAEEHRRRVLRVGDRISPFEIHDPEHGYLSSTDLLQKGPLIINFYRGLWCSYCQRDLVGVEEMLPDIRNANACVIAITHGLNSDVRARLRQAVNIGFPVVDDTDGLVAEQFGLRWGVKDADLIDAETGVDLISFRGTRPWILPMQARYLVRQDGVVAFANVAFDYNQRTEPAAVLPVLAKLAAS
jgi:peroxiredoxin